MSKIDFSEIFTEKMKEFLTKLQNLKRGKKGKVVFEDAYNNFCIASRLDKDAVTKKFYSEVHPFFDKINQKDEVFFLDSNNLKNTGNDTVSEYYEILQAIWSDTDTGSKESVWKYLHILAILSKKHCESR